MFSTAGKKIPLKCFKEVNVNRHIHKKIMSITLREGKVIDFTRTYRYPLIPIPLNLCNLDIEMRKTDKSKLLNIKIIQT